MDSSLLARIASDAQTTATWLRQLGVGDVERGHDNLQSLLRRGLSADLLVTLFSQLEQQLPKSSDPDLALNTLDRYLGASRNPLSFGSLCQQDPGTLTALLQLAAASRYLGDILVAEPEALELVRLTEGQPVAREHLVEEIRCELANLSERRGALNALRRHKRREILRIAYGDIVRQQRIPVVTEQLSFLADALCEGALAFARKQAEAQRGIPRGPDGQPARFVVLALGKLGGVELNYSSDIDLIFLYDVEGQTDGPRRVTNQEHFDRLAQELIKLLTEPTEWGSVYRVDVRLRPHGPRGPLTHRRDAALQYYDSLGRTWERQAFVKARPMTGDLAMGQAFLEMLEPWVYRRYLNRADITGVQALKRKIELRTHREGTDDRDVKTGRGGIRDTEFVIQFLQLLHGGDLPSVRTANTLDAIDRLAEVGCLTLQERTFLSDSYAFLRKLEHLLQIMLDVQTHVLPSSDDELTKLALRMGLGQASRNNTLQALRDAYRLHTERNRKILDHLLHDAFPDSPDPEPEVDLVLDPEPSPEFVRETLGRHAFRDIDSAYQHLTSLGVEKIPFLSTRRCRHFLASIAPALLRAIGATPDPDAALINLCQVSDSLGGKGVLWELFSFHPPSLQLYVRLCASSPYLSTILTSHPGMVDELMDSLLLNRLPGREALAATLQDRCRGAQETAPILHSFKNVQHLNAGVRDILGKEDIQRTTAFLSDVAEVCLQRICDEQLRQLSARYGDPWCVELDRPCELIVLALGKFGGREPNYHSDLDVVFLYEADGSTRPAPTGRGSVAITTNQHFFHELAQRIIKAVQGMGPWGRLYELDARLRPTGKNGPLALSLDAFQRYFADGSAQVWERQALCRARALFGSSEAQTAAMQRVRSILSDFAWQDDYVEAIRRMRLRLEDHASPRNLKRSPGGLMDIEFIVQMLQLQHAATMPQLIDPCTFTAIGRLSEAHLLEPSEARQLLEAYRFLRGVEARLRLMNTTARHDLPAEPRERDRLAYLLGAPNGETLTQQVFETLRAVRTIFGRHFPEPDPSVAVESLTS